MAHTDPQSAEEATTWVVALGSIAILFHLTAVVLSVLAAPSGPWPTTEGANNATPPQFAFSLHHITGPYLNLIKMTDQYHFPSNHTNLPGVSFEVRLKDKNGEEVKTLWFPEETAHPWVKQRQSLLARGLGDDLPVAPPMTEVIPAPNQPTRQVIVWESVNNDFRQLRLRSVPEHLIARDRPVVRPHEWSLLLARSYARYLCRSHDAASAEIIRHSRDAIPPIVLFLENVQAGAFEELISNFGEFQR